MSFFFFFEKENVGYCLGFNFRIFFIIDFYFEYNLNDKVLPKLNKQLLYIITYFEEIYINK